MIKTLPLKNAVFLASFTTLLMSCSPTTIRSLNPIPKTSAKIILASATITNTSPTNNSTYSITYGAVTGTYTKYCILENVNTVASCSWTSGTLPSTYVVNSTQSAKVLSIWLMDAAGNQSATVNTNSVTLDTTAPILASATITNTSPSPTTTYSLTYGAITGTYSDYCILENSTTVASCSWISGTLPASTLVSSAQNAKVLSIWLKDAASNISSRVDTNSVTLETTAPILASVTITNTSPTNSRTYSLTYGAITGAYTDYCILENSTTLASCSWITGTLPASYLVTAVEDAKVLSVWIKNAAGNQSARAFSNSVTLDTTAPILASAAITNTSPSNTRTYSLTYGAITGTYAKYCILENVTTVASCSWTTGTLPASYLVTAVQNAKVLSIWLMDAATNISSRVDTNSVTLDTLAPPTTFTWSMSSPANGTVSSDTTPNLSGTGAEPGATITAYSDSGCTSALGTAVVAGDGTFGSFTAFTLAIDGPKSFFYKITDPVANTSACTDTTQSYTLNTCVPSTLTWTTQPTNTAAGSSMVSPALTLKDAGGNVCVYSTETATITISTNTGNGKLSGTSTVSFSSGVASFAGLSIDKVGTAYKLAGQSSGGLFATVSSAFNITGSAAAKLVFLQAPNGYLSGASFSPNLAVQVSDASGNPVVVTPTPSITLSIDTNPGSATLAGGAALTQSSGASGVAIFSGAISIATIASGYTLRASCGACGLTDAVSAPFDIYGAGVGLNLEVPIEMLAIGFASSAFATPTPVPTPPVPTPTPSLTQFAPGSQISLDSNDYNGNPIFRFEIVATNTDTSPVDVGLRNPDNTVAVEVRIPAGTTTPTRFTLNSASALSTFTPIPGRNIYNISIPPTTSANQAKVYAARIMIAQTAATRTKIYIPLNSGVYDTAATTGSSSKVGVSTTSGTYGQSDSTVFSTWKKITTGLATLDPTTPFTFEAVMDSGTAGTVVNAALFNKTTGNMVTGSELLASNTNIILNSVSFLNTAANFTEGDDFEIRLKGIAAGGVRSNLYHGGLWVKLINLTKAESYYQILRKYTTASSGVLAYQRASIPTSAFSNPSSTMICTGKDGTAGTMSYNLFSATGQSDSAVTGSAVASGGISFGSTTKSTVSTSALSLTNNDRFLINFNYTSGTPSLTQCLLKVSSQ